MLASPPARAPKLAPARLPGPIAPDDAETHTRMCLYLACIRTAKLVRHIRTCQVCSHPDTLGDCSQGLQLALRADRAQDAAEQWRAIRDTPAPQEPAEPTTLF